MPRKPQIKTEWDFCLRKNYRRIIHLFNRVKGHRLHHRQIHYITLEKDIPARNKVLKSQRLIYKGEELSLSEIRVRLEKEQGFLTNVTNGKPMSRQQLNNMLRTMTGDDNTVDNKGEKTVAEDEEIFVPGRWDPETKQWQINDLTFSKWNPKTKQWEEKQWEEIMANSRTKDDKVSAVGYWDSETKQWKEWQTESTAPEETKPIVLTKDNNGWYTFSDSFRNKIQRGRNECHRNKLIESIRSYPLTNISWKIIRDEHFKDIPPLLKEPWEYGTEANIDVFGRLLSDLTKGLIHYTVFGLEAPGIIDDNVRRLAKIIREKGKGIDQESITMVITVPLPQH